jgi:hypothetical protein
MTPMAVRKYNADTPLRSFRLPNPEADRALVEAADAAGITVSEFIRRALAEALR